MYAVVNVRYIVLINHGLLTDSDILIKQRQFAWKQGDISKYRSLRNLVQRMAIGLRSKYYNRCVKSLRDAGPKQWWRAVKRITGQSHSMPLTSLAPNGNLDNLANDINVTFHGVSSDLHPVNLLLVPDDDGDYFPEYYVIEPYQIERKLAHF